MTRSKSFARLDPQPNSQHRSKGVTKGYQKNLEISGVGYRAALQGNKLVLSMGFSHPVEFEPEPGIEFEVPAPTRISVKGIDKQLVGETAARIPCCTTARALPG